MSDQAPVKTLTEEEQRRCCLLGGCGCTAGSPAQRGAMKSWLLDKISGHFPMTSAGCEHLVETWLSELPWST